MKKSNSNYHGHFSFFTLTIIAFLIIISDITFQVQSVKNLIGFVFFPTQKVFSSFFYNNKNIASNVKEMFFLYKKNEQLKIKINELKDIENYQEILSEENIRLKELLDYQDRSSEYLCAARVIGRTVDEWYRAIIVDKGIKHDVKIGDIVVIGKGILPKLVGQIIKTEINFSKVLLITDSNSLVAAFLNRSGIDGIIEGQNNTTMTMEHVRAGSNVILGDKVITSGLGGIFPRGLYMGTIKKVEVKIKNEGFNEILVDPIVDFTRLRDVFIISNHKDIKEELN